MTCRGGLQLVGDVGGELPAHGLRLGPLRRVQLQLGALYFELPLLGVQPPQQGRQLLVAPVFHGPVQIHLVEGRHDPFGQPPGQKYGQRQRQQDHRRHPLAHPQEHGEDRALGDGEAQHRAVR